jgi:hypothetical protein
MVGVEEELDLSCKHCQGRLGVSGGEVRCDECGQPAPDDHPLAALAKAPPPAEQVLPEPGPLETEATLAGRVLALERRVAALEGRKKREG